MKRRLTIISIVFLLCVAVVGVGAAVYLYFQNQALKTSTKSDADINASILKTLGTMMYLPDETPSIVSVTDREKLQSQEFFKKAENGDRVIIFQTARRIILFRPSSQKIVDVAPLVLQPTETGTPSAVVSPSASPKRIPTSEASSAAEGMSPEEQGNFRLQ